MEIYERIRFLRKDILKMSQEAFAERLGVSRPVIKNIELNALARPEQKLSLLKLICKEFNVSEDWLLNGIGEMYIQPDTFDLNAFARSNGATDLELQIIRSYFELDADVRKAVLEHLKKCFDTDSSV